MDIDQKRHAYMQKQFCIAQATALAHFEQLNLKNPFEPETIASIEYVRFLCALIKGI